MAIEHVDIADGERHEPKGADSAVNESVYVSDGANSGAWAWQPQYLVFRQDLANTAEDFHFVLPFAGTIDKIEACISGALTGADNTITAKISGVAVTNGVVTVAYSGSAEGDIFTATPTALNVFGSTDYIELNATGAATGAYAICITVTYTRTA